MNEQAELLFRGQPLETGSQRMGELRSSVDVLHDTGTLQDRFRRDGYLYLPGLLDRDLLEAARLAMLQKLSKDGYLDPNYPVHMGVAKGDTAPTAVSMKDLARDNAPLTQLLYSGAMIDFYERFLGGPVRHFDFTWCRVKPSGQDAATRPHYDIVYMGRGTKNLFTSWTPLGDVPKRMGGLMILENSHRQEEIKSTYGQLDVDVYCTNYDDAKAIESGEKLWQRPDGGAYAEDAIALRRELDGRWLTADYQLGDLLIFGMYTMHASMDNLTDRLRLSTDTRYQLASEPVDERWIGEDPIAHGPEAKQGMIC